jgi:hypothetical protein
VNKLYYFYGAGIILGLIWMFFSKEIYRFILRFDSLKNPGGDFEKVSVYIFVLAGMVLVLFSIFGIYVFANK